MHKVYSALNDDIERTAQPLKRYQSNTSILLQLLTVLSYKIYEPVVTIDEICSI